jgi:hypothetical protein
LDDHLPFLCSRLGKKNCPELKLQSSTVATLQYIPHKLARNAAAGRQKGGINHRLSCAASIVGDGRSFQLESKTKQTQTGFTNDNDDAPLLTMVSSHPSCFF